MLRLEKDNGWILITHPAHGKLAGHFAAAWGNETFLHPEPIDLVNLGVTHHDDAWAVRDADPFVTREGLPSAFSKELVGTYDSFEEIDMADYLAVRGAAAEKVAEHAAYSAILVSMHTHNLLTAHVDPATLTEDQAGQLDTFLKEQTARRVAWIEACSTDPKLTANATPEALQWGFEFLQACDSLSLIACVGYQEPIFLQHEHPMADGSKTKVRCEHLGEHRFHLDPFPFQGSEQSFSVPYRLVEGIEFQDNDALRCAWHTAPEQNLEISFCKRS
ncbi:MAG: DUF3891 family protein [Opitutales bacterium]|nr:DUF3891 family protein [Opitutales bacterium]